LVFQPHDA